MKTINLKIPKKYIANDIKLMHDMKTGLDFVKVSVQERSKMCKIPYPHGKCKKCLGK